LLLTVPVIRHKYLFAMKPLKTALLPSLLAALLFTAPALALQKQAGGEPAGLALEIIFYKGMPPAYQTVSPAVSSPKGAWYGRFGRVSSWQPPEGALPVRAVNVTSRKEGDAVRVNVSVFVGAKFFDKEEPVATYLVRENEKVTASELARFGVEPFEITLVKVQQSVSAVPSVTSGAESIVVEGVEANASTFPSYTLSLRNASTKNVVAIQIEVLLDGKTRLLNQPQGKEGRPLIEAAGSLQTTVPGIKEALMTRQGYTPDSPRGQSILISTAIFEDGTYEGKALMAAQIRARMMGQKLQVARIVELLGNVAEADGSESPAVIERLKQNVSSLQADADPAGVDELLKNFPDLNGADKNVIKAYFDAALHAIKKDLLGEIDRLEKSHKGSPDINGLKAWLGETRERYKQWLSRLH
jgi:hypothetical protein